MKSEIAYLIIAFIIAAIIGRIIIPILKKHNVKQTERLDGPRTHLKKKNTPTMGGIIIGITMLLVCIIACIINHDNISVVIPLLIVSLGFGLVGFIDDLIKVILKRSDGLSPKAKMFGQLIVAVIFIIYILNFTDLGTGIRVPFSEDLFILPTAIYVILMIFVMLGTTNAINLTDGVDGLAGSVSAIIIATLSIIAFKCRISGISIFSAICCGATVGFLIYNFYKAKIMMGDTGSLLLGGIISSIAIYLRNPLILILVAIVPIIETLSVMVQVAVYSLFKKRVLKMAPLHHHFELTGWRENRVVAVFSAVTLIACILAIIIA